MSDKEIQEAYERAEKNYEMLKDRVHEQYFEIVEYHKEIATYKQAYESMKESNQRLKTYIEKYKNIIDELEKWLIAQRDFIETIDIMPNLKEVKLEHKIMINDYTATLNKLKELKGE